MRHNTLNESLEAAGVSDSWPLGFNLDYNHTGRVVSNGVFISVTRFDCGMYETAITYTSQCDDFQHDTKNN